MSEGAIFASSSWPSADTDAVASTTSATTPATGTASTPTTATTTLAALVDAARTLIHSTSTTAATTTTISTTTTTTHKPTVSAGAATKINVTDLSSSLQHFGIVDYFVFILMLVVCAVIGFYFGFIEKKQKKQQNKKQNGKSDDMANVEQRRGSEALDYLVGGRKMKVIPVSLSLVASFVSGISLLGTSTEIYVYGTQYAFILITLAISGLISWYIFLPVFCNLQLTSTYEYFELRFDRRVRIFGSVLFVSMMTLWMPICIYVPAITFNQVTGINIHIIVPIVCVVCTLYTCIGGIKGVVWTDVLQSIVMIGSMALVIIKGITDIGGFGIFWERNMAADRLVPPELTFDPRARMGIFAVFIGGTIFKLQANCINQAIVQRFLTLPNLKAVKHTLILSMVGFLLVLGMCMFIGLLAFAEYYECDPITTGLAKQKDQIIPLYVMQIAGIYPGFVGLFVAGVFSAALSSLSTALNSLSGVILKDFIETYRRNPLTERQTAYILRTVVLSFGILSMAMVNIVEHLGMVMQLSSTVAAITCGPLLGAFSVGMLLPFVKTESLLTGCVLATTLTGYIVTRAQVAIAMKELQFPIKPVSVDGCTYDFVLPKNWNATFDNGHFYEDTEFQMHHISFLFYTLVGAGGTIICSLIASLYFGKQDPSVVAPELLAPCVRSFWHKDYKSTKRYANNGCSSDQKVVEEKDFRNVHYELIESHKKTSDVAKAKNAN